MKKLLLFSVVAALIGGLMSCSKNSVDPSADASARTTGTVSTSLTGPHNFTVVDASSLPAAITTFITTNYAGASVKEAVKDDKGNYLVAITLNNTLKLLLFKDDGTFVKEASAGKRGPHDRDSTHHSKDSTRHHAPGDSLGHPKRPMGDSLNHPRPGGTGPQATTVAVSSLPAAITSYVNTNYAGATIEKAVQDKPSSDYLILIVTTDKKRVLLLFSSDGTFKKALAGKR
ncbi:hypothetical protein GCM10028805_43910 [Spirosoma harenae]